MMTLVAFLFAQIASVDLAAVRRVDAAYADAWRANDGRAVLSLFAPDAVIVPQGHAPIAGLKQMIAFWWPSGGGRTTVTSFANDIVEVGGSGDFAFSRGTYTFTFDYELDGRLQKLTNHGNYMMLFHKDGNGAWKITHRMWSDLPRTSR